MTAELLPGFGEEIAELQFSNFWDWFVKVNDPAVAWKAQPTYVLSQVTIIVGALLALIHALKNGGRLPYLWAATVLHGLVVECISYGVEDVDNFWHSQAIVMLLGRRLPLHIIAVYPVFIYNAVVAASQMNLHRWAEPFAAGLLAVLIDIPYDIVCVKFIHWTWHDTDPNIADRHYWVPWNSYYFHAAFTASFTFWFTAWRNPRWKVGSSMQEVRSCFLVALLGIPCGVLLFLPIYHPLHDIANVHTEVTYFMLFSVFLMIVWSSDRAKNAAQIDVQNKYNEFLWMYLIAYYSLFMGIVLFGHPENDISIGLHETTGPCNEMAPIYTAFGMVLQKRRYLCVSDYDEGYFDFHCLPNAKPPVKDVSWYTICGTPFNNRIEYIAVIGTICLLATCVFWNVYCRTISSSKNVNRSKILKHKTQ